MVASAFLSGTSGFFRFGQLFDSSSFATSPILGSPSFEETKFAIGLSHFVTQLYPGN